ncbi:copper resistance system multicopper oxidase [Shewanella bicestrii]
MSLKNGHFYNAEIAKANQSRRQFVTGLAVGGILVGLSPLTALAKNQQSTIAETSSPSAKHLYGTTFNLEINELPVNFTGSTVMATAINGQLPAPTLHWREGDTITINVTNRLKESTSIHWHGIILPSEMDGVPGLSYSGIGPGETFQYRFKVQQAGTYWYHSHTRFQEQTGIYGAIVIEPREPRFSSDQDHVVLLSDWSDTDPETIFTNLKKMSSYYSQTEPTTSELLNSTTFTDAWNMRMMWNKMRMSPRDLSDVTGYTYTFLTNGVTPAGNWTVLFKRGQKIRLRFVNASAMTYFDVRIPGLKMTVVAADGQDVEPVTIDEFRIAVAETLDVIVSPADDSGYAIFAQAIDRSGYAMGALSPNSTVRPQIPLMDPIPSLTMADMGMAMSDMNMSGANMTDKHRMDTSGMNPMDMPNERNMDMSGMSGMEMSGGHKMSMSMNSHQYVPISHHYATEFGPGNTKRIEQASTALDDPGAGLRNNGRRVLTYADLHTLGGPLDPRPPEREIELHLTGNMERYLWSFNGIPYSEAKPILLHYGERVRIILINDTMMNHPIHLHGMWSEVETANGEFQVRKHTVNVRPAQRISYLVHADAKGRWAYHCHMLYHMDAGMFRAVVVA